MKKFKTERILIPIDFSETSLLAIEHGAFMAKLCKADLFLLHVLEKNYTPFNIVETNVVVEEAAPIHELINQKLEEITENIREDYGVATETICSDGNICNEIVNVALEKQIDIIVMGTHGASGFEEFFIGSNTYKVVTKAEIPVLSVQTHSTRLGFSNIILPVDNSEHSQQKVGHTLLLAKQYGSKVHVLGLLNSDSDENDTKKLNIKLEHVQKYFEKHGVAADSTALKGKNHGALTMQHAVDVKADLIVIMTDQVEEGIFLGPYAQQVVNHSRIPVLSITPKINPDNIPWVHPY